MSSVAKVKCEKCGMEDVYEIDHAGGEDNTIKCKWCGEINVLTEVIRKDAHLAAMEEQAKEAAEKAQEESKKVSNNLEDLRNAMRMGDATIQEMLKTTVEIIQSQYDGLTALQKEHLESYRQIQQTRADDQDVQCALIQREAEQYKANGQFEKAAEKYQSLINLYPQEADYRWQLAVCEYGIEYVKDVSGEKYVPTLTRSIFDAMQSNPNYRSALSLAGPEMKTEYENRAKLIDDLLIKYKHVCQNERPYDVFISVKQGDEHQHPTQDSADAQDLYYKLVGLKKKDGNNLRVFNSRITLSQYHAGSEYEPYIIHALTTAKALIVVCSNEEYINSPWVRNEWRRYLYLMRQAPDRKLILYNGMKNDAAIPEELKVVQYIRQNKLDSFGEIKAALRSILDSEDDYQSLSLNQQLTKIRELLSKKEFDEAKKKVTELLSRHPFSAQGNIFLLMCNMRIGVEIQLQNSSVPLDEYEEFTLALDCANRSGDKELLNRLLKYKAEVDRRLESAHSQEQSMEADDSVRDSSTQAVNEAVLMRVSQDQECVFRSDVKKTAITSVIFLNNCAYAARDAWDASAKGDNSVQCWLRGSALYIAGEGGVKANEDSSNLFNGWSNLKAVAFSNRLDTSAVTSMHAMFKNCGNLTEVNLSELNTSHVKDLSSMFENCGNLSKLDLSNFDISNVTNASAMFSGCKNLTELYLSRLNDSTEAHDMFKGCVRLRINSSKPLNESKQANKPILMRVAKDQKLAFRTNIKKNTITSVTFLNSLRYAPANSKDVKDASENCDRSVLCWAKGTNLFIAGEGGVKANADSSSLFEGWKALRTIKFDSNFDTSEVRNMRTMFQNCVRLTTLDVFQFDTSQVTDMGFMFDKCESLTVLDVANFDTSSVTDMSSMFQGCSKLLALNVSRFDTSNVREMDFMFNQCMSLKNLDVSHFNTSSVTNMARMFQMCTNLAALDVSCFNTSNVTNMCSMFSQCSNLTELDVSHFNTSKVRDMSNMFFKCRKMSKLDLSYFKKTSLQYSEGILNGCGGFFFNKKLQAQWQKCGI